MALYHKAAKYGSPRAQMLLARAYYTGRGTAEDREKSMFWLKSAAYQRYGDAMHRLGVCYEYGDGVQQDWTRAARWFREAAEDGVGAAMTDIGYCYERGYGVEQDWKQAVSWYRRLQRQDKAWG